MIIFVDSRSTFLLCKYDDGDGGDDNYDKTPTLNINRVVIIIRKEF